jgi:hypothetical protein
MLKTHAEFGVAPVGCEVVEWDWSEDDLGHRTKVEYTMIPSSAVEVRVDWSQLRFDDLLDTVQWVGSAGDYETRVVRFTVHDEETGSFVASTWVRYAEAVKMLNEFAGLAYRR